MSTSATEAGQNPPAATTDPAYRPRRSSSSRVWGRWLAVVGAVAVGCSAAALSLMQVLPAGEWLDPVSTPLSNYALTGAGRWFDAALLLLLVAELVLVGALVLAGLVRIGSFAFAVLGLCAVGLGAMVVFPDRATVTGQLTISGWLHLGASVLAFGGPPLACLALARRHQQAAGCSRLPGVLGWLGAFALGWFAVLVTVTALGWVAGATTGTTTGTTGGWPVQWAGGAGTSVAPWQYYPYDSQYSDGSELGGNYGLIERGLTAAELLIALVLLTWAWRGCRCRISRSERDGNGAAESPMPVGPMAGDSTQTSKPMQR